MLRNQRVCQWPVADLRKMVLSAAYGGALQWRKISVLVDLKQISGFKKVKSKKKKKKVLCPTTYYAAALGPFTYLLAQLLLFFFVGAPD